MKKLLCLFLVFALFAFGCSKDSDETPDVPDGPDIQFYTLTISTTTGGSVDSEGGTYEQGEEITITATPEDGYIFQNWSGDENSSDNPLIITMNDDVDIIISTEARNQIFNGDTKFIRTNGVEIFEQNKGKFKIFDAQGDDDLIENYSFKVNGYNFLEPRFYFSRKNKHTDRDKSDWKGMRKFFEMESHLGYPFNQLTEQQWGVKYCENI